MSAGWLTSERLSGTVTFLFTDIEGSTGLLKRLGRGRYGELLAEQQRLLREAFAAHNGEEIDTQGDSFFVAFRSASDAVSAAVAMERSLADHEWPDGVEVRVRIGIHSGEASAAGERYVGFSVHRAARVGDAAHGGQVLISDSTRTLVEDDLPEGVSLRDLGLWRLKDVDRPERLAQVTAEGVQLEFPPLRGAEQIKSRPLLRRRSALAAALVGVIAAAVAIPVFALGSGSGGSDQTAEIAANSVGALDATSGRLLASTGLESTPGAVVADRSSVWVTNPDNDGVTRIDPKTNTRVQTIGVGTSPAGVTVGGGFVWIANSLARSVSKIDPNANGGSGAVVDTIPVGNGPSGVAYADGRIWVANSVDRTVMEFALGAGKPLRTIPVATGADAIASGYGFVWIVSGGGNSVTRINERTGTVLPPIGVGNNPIAIAVGGGAAWVANNLDGTVSRIDPLAGTVTGITVGGSPVGIAAANGAVWVSDDRAGTVSRIDPIGERAAQTVTTGNRPGRLALAGNRLYVAVRTSGASHRGGTLTAYPTETFDSIDPAATYQVSSWAALILTNDGLIGFQRVGGSDGTRLVPDLATSIPTPTDGGRTYTFQVRSGIHYSTGALVQPADLRRAIERSLQNPKGAGSYYTEIVGATSCLKPQKRCELSEGVAVDPASRTITFHLRAPDPDFLDKLALSSAYAIPANTPLNARLPLPATGPYMISRYNLKRGLTLVRNPRFKEWSRAAQPAGYPDKIVFKFGGKPASIDAVKQGKADYTDEASASNHRDAYAEAAALQRDGYGRQLHINPVLASLFYFLNTRLPPFNDVRVRRAMNYAVDRNRLLALQGKLRFGQPSCQVLPPNFPGYARYCPYSHSLAKARQLVAESGTRGAIVTLWSVAIRAPSNAYVMSVLRSLGYKARLKLGPVKGNYPDFAGYFRAIADSRNKVQIAPTGLGPDFPAAGNVFAPLLTCSAFKPNSGLNLNPAEFCNRRIDAEIRHALSVQASDPQAASALWSKVDRDIVDQAPMMFYGTFQQADFVSKRVGNYQYNPQWGVLFDQLWVK